MNDNKQKKAKIILNSEINNEVEENVPQREDDILGDPIMNFNYNGYDTKLWRAKKNESNKSRNTKHK